MKMGRPKSGARRGLTIKQVKRWRGQNKPMAPSVIAERCGVTRQAVYQFMWRHKIK